MKAIWTARWRSCQRSGGNAGHPLEFVISAQLHREQDRMVHIVMTPAETRALVHGLQRWLEEEAEIAAVIPVREP